MKHGRIWGLVLMVGCASSYAEAAVKSTLVVKPKPAVATKPVKPPSKPVLIVPQSTASVKETPLPTVTEAPGPDPKVLARLAKAEELFGQARQSFSTGKFDDAYQFAAQAVSLNADHLDAQDMKASLAVDLGRPAESIPAYQAVIRLAPERMEARKRLGNVLMRAGRHLEAIAEYEAFLDIQASDTPVRYNLARCQALSGKSAESLASLKRVIEKQTSYKMTAPGDPAFAALKELPAFKQLVGQ